MSWFPAARLLHHVQGHDRSCLDRHSTLGGWKPFLVAHRELRFDCFSRSGERKFELDVRRASAKPLTPLCKLARVPNGPSEQPWRKRDVRETFRASRARSRCTAVVGKWQDSWALSSAICGQRDYRPKAYWRWRQSRANRSPQRLQGIYRENRQFWAI